MQAQTCDRRAQRKGAERRWRKMTGRGRERQPRGETRAGVGRRKETAATDSALSRGQAGAKGGKKREERIRSRAEETKKKAAVGKGGYKKQGT